MQLVEFQQTRADLVAEILPLMKAHSRINNDDVEDALCALYIAGAIAAAENYLMRDVFPTVRRWSGDLSSEGEYGRDSGYYVSCRMGCAVGGPSGSAASFSVRHGRARTIAMTTGEGEAAVPVDPAQYVVRASPDPKTWGFEVAPLASLSGVTLEVETGWETFAEMPPDLQEFILVAAGAMYEVRELSNSGGSIGSQEAKFLPMYLLDTWANLTYA